MVGVVDRWFRGSSPWHKEDASCPAAPRSFVSPAKRNNNCSASPTPTPPRKPEPFVVGSSSAAAKPTAPPTSRSPRNSAAIPLRSGNGEHASPPTAWPAWLTSRAAVRRGLFPPEDRHKVVVLATTKPAELGLPFSHWSLGDLALQILKDAHYRDMSRSTVQRLLNRNDLKPH